MLYHPRQSYSHKLSFRRISLKKKKQVIEHDTCRNGKTIIKCEKYPGCPVLRCLIFQLIHVPSIPQSLLDPLEEEFHVFFGVGIKGDIEKLLLRPRLARRPWWTGKGFGSEGDGAGDEECRVEEEELSGWEIERPKKVSTCQWDDRRLTKRPGSVCLLLHGRFCFSRDWESFEFFLKF